MAIKSEKCKQKGVKSHLAYLARGDRSLVLELGRITSDDLVVRMEVQIRASSRNDSVVGAKLRYEDNESIKKEKLEGRRLRRQREKSQAEINAAKEKVKF